MTTTAAIEHESFCLPQPGEDKPRTETFRSERTGKDGITVTSRPTVRRCIECGAQTVSG